MATRDQQIAFIVKAAPAAQQAYAIFGKVHPSVAIGMACVECGYGTAGSVKHHSYLGHKVGSGKTATKYWGGRFFTAKTKEEYTKGTHTVITDAFRSYDSIEQCFLNFYELLNTRLYEKVQAGVDYKTQMQQIRACGYMTSYTEVNSVVSIIEKFGLTEYDSVGVKPKTEYTAGMYKVQAGVLNIRKDGDATSIDMGDLYKNSVIAVDEVKDGWGHFSGWCKLSYCRKM